MVLERGTTVGKGNICRQRVFVAVLLPTSRPLLPIWWCSQTRGGVFLPCCRSLSPTHSCAGAIALRDATGSQPPLLTAQCVVFSRFQRISRFPCSSMMKSGLSIYNRNSLQNELNELDEMDQSISLSCLTLAETLEDPTVGMPAACFPPLNLSLS